MLYLSYYKPKNKNIIEYLEKTVDNIQNYIPTYSLFFELNETNYNKISLNHVNQIINFNSIYNIEKKTKKQTQIYIKYSPLLDPIHYMMGKYDLKDKRIKQLPQLKSTEEDCISKVLNTNNSSYIDGFFTFLSSKLLHHHNFFHGVDYYGSFLGIQKNFIIDIIEDIDHLDSSDYFHNNLNKLFMIDSSYESNYPINNSRKNKSTLIITEDNTIDINIETFSDIIDDGESIFANFPLSLLGKNDPLPILNLKDKEGVAEEELSEMNLEYENNNINANSLNSSDDDDSSLNYSTEEENKDENCSYETISENSDETKTNTDDSDSSIESTEPLMNATIYNFPVNLICMEKCNGTLDSLINNLNDDEWRSALFQIIMILIVYQKAFYLTHNDLHTNNIMYISTEKKYLFYKYNNKFYKVPTYGKIYKIIDYGRAIYTFNGKLFCSDSFNFEGDASTQYNFPPYYNDKKPLIEPNYSFDLCRLGCSIYDFIFENENDEPKNEIEKLILEWCIDDNGKNIMYKKNGEERYLEFKLYKMIARTVHNHTPEKQLNRPFFQKYLINNITEKEKNLYLNNNTKLYLNIDIIPSYAEKSDF